MCRGCRFSASGTPFIYGSCDFHTNPPFAPRTYQLSKPHRRMEGFWHVPRLPLFGEFVFCAAKRRVQKAAAGVTSAAGLDGKLLRREHILRMLQPRRNTAREPFTDVRVLAIIMYTSILL